VDVADVPCQGSGFRFRGVGCGVWGESETRRSNHAFIRHPLPTDRNFHTKPAPVVLTAQVYPVRLVTNRVGNRPGGLVLHAPLCSRPRARAETLVGTNEEGTKRPPNLGFKRDAERGRARSVPSGAIAASQTTCACAGQRASEGRARCCRGGGRARRHRGSRRGVCCCCTIG